MNIQESIREWIDHRVSFYASLEDIQIAITGEEDDVTPPFIAIYEGGVNIHTSNGVVMYGVSEFDIMVEIHTVPSSADDNGTPIDIDQTMRRDLYDIVGDRDMIDWINMRNHFQVFDIDLSSPITESGEGQRITKFALNIIASPI